MLFFYKAIIPGGALGNLFDMPVRVAGYTTKDGTYVAPTTAIRRKRAAAPPVDLFAHHVEHADSDLLSFHHASAHAPAPAPALAPAPAPAPEEVIAPAPEYKRFTYTTTKGKRLTGVLRPDLTEDQAKALDAYAFKPKGVDGWFMRDREAPDVKNPNPVKAAVNAAADPSHVQEGKVPPKAVMMKLQSYVSVLKEARKCLDLGIASDKARGGQGRYESETMKEFAAKIADANRYIANFIRMASTRGVDGAAVLATLGVPDLSLSPVGQAYVDGSSKVPPAPAPVAAEPQIAWGVPAGISKEERRALNAEAVAILAGKTDAEMTHADKAVLAQYSGNGGCGDSLNEFYTDPAVASAMWTLIGRAGFVGGDVLEPSSGAGVFLHTAPSNARVTAVELEPISARIASILHTPAGHEVRNASLERFATQDGRKFAAVIGNVPFGLRGEMIRDDKRDLSKAEQYFVDTALDKTVDGGLVALIVPTGIMDSSSGRAFRERALRKGEFLGAYRLPNTAFEASHTGVTSDIVLFRKRPQDVAGALSTVDRATLEKLGIWDGEMVGGGYVTGGRGASNVFGTLEPGWRAKAGMGDDITVSGSMVGVPAAIAEAPIAQPIVSPDVPTILAALGDDEAAQQRAISAALKSPYQEDKLGDVRVIDGIAYVLQGEPPRWHKAATAEHPAVTDARAVADLIDDLVAGRVKDPTFARTNLIEALDDFVRAHGAPARNKHFRQWLNAPSLPNIGGVSDETHAENVNAAHRRAARLLGAVRDDGSYSDLVTGEARAVGLLDFDTIATKLSLASSGFTVEQIADATGQDREAVLEHLFASPAYAVNGDGVTWSTLDTYVSGDLWEKFDAANIAASLPELPPEYQAKLQAQAAILEEAIGPKSLEDVEININSGFITTDVINAWGLARVAQYKADNPGASWSPTPFNVEYDDGVYVVTGDNWGDGKLIDKYLNRTGVRKDSREDLAKLNEEFAVWVRGSDVRQSVEDRYNRTHRGFRAPAYSDAPIEIPGLNPALKVNSYHYAGIRWALTAGKGIIAADVGLGKTGRGLMLAKLAKATGEAKKPTFVVPKSVLANWINSAEFWFPGSKVLVIGETYSTDKAGNVTSKSDDAATRQRKLHEMQQNDYDFVFISQPAWNFIDVDPVTKEGYIDSEFWTKRGDKIAEKSGKAIKKMRTAHDQESAKRDFSNREGTIYFNDLGIDMLLIDEATAYKNLYAAKNRFGMKPKFLGGSGLSNCAQDTYFKSRSLREANGNKGVYLLTATPTKNSPLEIYSMLSHIAPDAFERMGIKNSEEFLDRFCEFTHDTILGVNGELVDELVTSGFKNMDELREVMRRYIDRTTAEDVGLVMPSADRLTHYIDMTPAQNEVYHELRTSLAEGKKEDDTANSHVFSVMAQMGKVSVDMSLYNPKYAGERSPKLEEMVKTAVAGSADGGQVIFCDHVDMHEKIAAAFVAAGVPRNQIGIINGEATPGSAARQSVSDKFNSGKFRFVIGNTPTMGEGVNLQMGTTDIHHLDLLWEPASMQQRDGRGLRQGNTNEAVRIHTYLAKGSFDGYRYQTIAAKKDWQDMLWNGGDRVENLAREGAFSRIDELIMLSADPAAEREKYNKNTAEAKARKLADDKTAAIAEFMRLQKMRTSMTRMKGQGIENSSTRRLEIASEKASRALRNNAAFQHKDLLKSTYDAVIEPTTGYAWIRNKGFVLDGGSDGPFHWSDKPTRWVVTNVDPVAATVTARLYGTALTSKPITMDLDRMKEGVAPFEFSAEEESKALDEEATASRKLREHTVSQKVKSGEALRLEEIRHLPPETIAAEADAIQKTLKHAIDHYKDGTRHAYGLIDGDGKVSAVRGYEARGKLHDHSLILPLPDHKEKAIAGYVRDGLARQMKMQFGVGRQGRPGAAIGLKPVYPGHEYGSDTTGKNPWEHVMRDVFGEESVKPAEAALRQAVHQQIASAPTFRDAVKAATAALDFSHAGGYSMSGGPRWPADVAQSLAARARADGVMNDPLVVAAAPSDSAYADLHTAIFDHSGHSHGKRGWDGSASSVKEFLAAISPTKDRAALLADAPMKEAA